MIQKNKRVTIKADGKTTGIIVEMISKETGKRGQYITVPDANSPSGRKTRVFDNLEVAKLIAELNYKDRYDFEYFVKFQNISVDIRLCQKVGEYKYQYIDSRKDSYCIYTMEEKHNYRISNIGYIVFEDGDVKRCESKEGYPKCQKYFSDIESILSGILLDNEKYGIEYINHDEKNDEYIAKVKGTTARIHILKNAKLMDFNQSRRSQNMKVLFFNKEMDKFLTFYFYIAKDYTEPLKNDGDEKASKVMEYIMSDLYSMYDDPEINPRFIPLEIKNNKSVILEDL